MKTVKYNVLPGDPETLGAKQLVSGINFAFAVPEGREAALVITDGRNVEEEWQRIPLEKEKRTGRVSSVLLEGAAAEDIAYYYEVGGKRVPDPYATGFRQGACTVMPAKYDWEGDLFPETPLSELMIYKLHVRGFTKKAKKVRRKGTFAGILEMLPYIEDLGFNAIELMPMYEWDDRLFIRPFSEETKKNGDGAAKAVALKNYWGYAQENYYFAPKSLYAASADACGELRELVKALHRRKMEIYMEIYFPEGTDPFMAMLAIRFWKSQYRIDGFHFVGPGTPVSSIVKDPLLTRTKLCFEDVDAGWVYGGREPEERNLLICRDDFEHTGRALLKGDEGQTGEFAYFLRRNPSSHGYVNYMANVNGFTLFDSVCYDRKHNEKNGEDNQDGPQVNVSWNCGVEGPSRKRLVRELRIRQVKNALLYTFLAQGTPLLLAGDEGCNTQDGNNNAYASDDATGWTDWNEGKDASEIRHFTKKLTAFRKNHPVLHMEKELKGTDYRSFGCPDISFHDDKAWVCGFENTARTLAVMYNGQYTQEKAVFEEDAGRKTGKKKKEKVTAEAKAEEKAEFLYVAYNAYWEAHSFALPALPAGWAWYPAIDSAAPAGQEFMEDEKEPCQDQKYAEAYPRSVLVLTGRREKA